jgi:hypothetical protein
MPGPLFHVGAVATCPHVSGQITIASTNTRVFVNGLPVVTLSDNLPIAGCPFTVPGPKPQPCVTAKFIPAGRVLVNGQPAIIVQAPPGVCQSAEQIPQGPPIVNTVQTRVIGM